MERSLSSVSWGHHPRLCSSKYYRKHLGCFNWVADRYNPQERSLSDFPWVGSHCKAVMGVTFRWGYCQEYFGNTVSEAGDLFDFTTLSESFWKIDKKITEINATVLFYFFVITLNFCNPAASMQDSFQVSPEFYPRLARRAPDAMRCHIIHRPDNFIRLLTAQRNS